MATKTPVWLTPIRKTTLVRLFDDSRGFCVYGHTRCSIPEHHYSMYIEYLIKDWQSSDRDQRLAEWDAERLAMHNLGEQRYSGSGRFNSISRDIYASNQPLYFLEGQTISGVTLKPFVRVRLSSSYMRLYVDLTGIMRKLSKSARRKRIRYGKPLPQEIESQISALVLKAYRDYINN